VEPPEHSPSALRHRSRIRIPGTTDSGHRKSPHPSQPPGRSGHLQPAGGRPAVSGQRAVSWSVPTVRWTWSRELCALWVFQSGWPSAVCPT